MKILIDKNKELIKAVNKMLVENGLQDKLQAKVGDIFKEAEKNDCLIATASNPDFDMAGGLDLEIKKRFSGEVLTPYLTQETKHLYFIVSVNFNRIATKDTVASALTNILYSIKDICFTGIGTGIGGMEIADFVDVLKDVLNGNFVEYQLVIGNDLMFGYDNEFGSRNKFGKWNKFENGNEFGKWNKFGYDNELGKWNKFGDGNEFGGGNKFGDCYLHHLPMTGSGRTLRKLGKICEKEKPTIKDFWLIYSGESTTVKKGKKNVDCYVFYKAVKGNRTTRGKLIFKDKTWVRDTNKFNKKGSCVIGGIYFSGLNYVINFDLTYTTILKVAIPKKKRNVVIDPDGNKARTDELYVMGEYGKC